MSLEIFSCRECDRTFDTRGRFNQHSNTHKKPYICETCGRGFGLRADLLRHTNARHQVGNARYNCGVPGCIVKVSRKDNIAKHLKDHHPEKYKDSRRKQSQFGAKQNGGGKGSVSQTLEPKTHTVFNWWLSAGTGNTLALRSLLDAGFNVDSQAGDGNTALHCASRAGQTETISFLLEKGARLDIENERFETPLFEAAVGGQLQSIMLLLRAGGSVNNFGSYDGKSAGFVDHIVRVGDRQLVEAVLEIKIPQFKRDRASKARAIASTAARVGQVSILELIIRSDPEVFEYKGRESTPIDYAVACGQISSVQTLLVPSGLSKGHVTIPRRGLSRLLGVAIKRGFLAILQILLEYNPTATITPDYLLHPVGMGGRLEVFQYLLFVSKFHVDLQNRRRDTALHVAARGGHLNIVEALMSHGAQHDLLNYLGETPLLAAFWHNKLDVIRVLSKYDDTILEPQEVHLQATSLAEVAQRLLDKQKLSLKSRGYAQDYLWERKSLLYLAAEFDDLELAKLLLNHRDWDPQDINMNHSEFSWQHATALDIAKHIGHTGAAEFLIEHGALERNPIVQRQQEQHAQITAEPDHSNGKKDSEMQEDEDLTFDSDLEEQPYSYVGEYMNPHLNEVETLEEPGEAAKDTRTWMDTVLAG
ncbi:hypothetical protein M3J09_010601 [Ascochyta lentis]